MIKIDKNIPVPSKLSSKDFPFELMEIGDSFLYVGNIRAIRQLVYKLQKRTDRQYQTRQEDADGLRIWRIE